MPNERESLVWYFGHSLQFLVRERKHESKQCFYQWERLQNFLVASFFRTEKCIQLCAILLHSRLVYALTPLYTFHTMSCKKQLFFKKVFVFFGPKNVRRPKCLATKIVWRPHCLATKMIVKKEKIRDIRGALPGGKGKGAPEFWVCRVKPGRIIFEVDGVSESVAREALYKASTKLPIKTKFVKRF